MRSAWPPCNWEPLWDTRQLGRHGQRRCCILDSEVEMVAVTNPLIYLGAIVAAKDMIILHVELMSPNLQAHLVGWRLPM